MLNDGCVFRLFGFCDRWFSKKYSVLNVIIIISQNLIESIHDEQIYNLLCFFGFDSDKMTL